MKNTLYSEPVWTLFHDLQHLGSLGKDALSARADAEDKQMIIYARFDTHGIIEAKAEVLGSPVLMALAEYSCRQLEGLALPDVATFLDNFSSRVSESLLLSLNEAHLVYWVSSILHSLLRSNGEGFYGLPQA